MIFSADVLLRHLVGFCVIRDYRDPLGPHLSIGYEKVDRQLIANLLEQGLLSEHPRQISVIYDITPKGLEYLEKLKGP